MVKQSSSIASHYEYERILVLRDNHGINSIFGKNIAVQKQHLTLKDAKIHEPAWITEAL